MTTLADKSILSGADNPPPILEKDMYDSWKSRMKLYIMNRQHGRMILESVENGPLLWPSIEENGVTRPKKYSELSATEAIQADCDYGSPYQSSQYRSHTQSSIPLSITYPPNDFQSSVHQNVYNPSSSIPQVKYAPSVNQHSDFSQPDSGLIVPVFQKGDDPIDAINNMMSFVTAVVTSRYSPTSNRLRNSSNPHQQATINNGRVTIQPIQGRHTSLAAVNCTKINLDNKSINETLTDELERYKDKVRILKEGNNVDKILDSCAKSVEINNLKQTLSEHLKEKESLKQTVTLLKNDFQKEESRNIDRELALEKQIKELNNIVFKRNQSTQTVSILRKLSSWNQSFMMAVEQHRVELKGFQVKMNNILNENERLLEQAISKDIAVEQHRVELKGFQVKMNNILNENERLLEQAISDKLMAMNPMYKTKKDRFTEPVTSSGKKPIKTLSSSNVVSNKPTLSSTGVTLPTSASGSQPSGNTKNDRIQQTPSSAKKNKLEAYPRNAVQIVLWYLDSGCSKHMIKDRSQLTIFFNQFLGPVKFGNDHVAKIMGYGDYKIENVTISRVYSVEGLGHNLFSVG
nr:integrase, catalytic region, zinc finger, CCHC-type, peptidase aspartic, catalytic [Tanacetum cinerariifolium]